MDEQRAAFTNRFQLAVNAAAQEVVINFSYRQPHWNHEGMIDAVSEMPATAVVMSVATAKELIKILSDCITTEESKTSAQ